MPLHLVDWTRSAAAACWTCAGASSDERVRVAGSVHVLATATRLGSGATREARGRTREPPTSFAPGGGGSFAKGARWTSGARPLAGCVSRAGNHLTRANVTDPPAKPIEASGWLSNTESVSRKCRLESVDCRHFRDALLFVRKHDIFRCQIPKVTIHS